MKDIKLDMELKEKLDSYLFSYSTSEEGTGKLALELLYYAFLTLTDIREASEIEFDILRNNTDLKKIEELKTELKLSKFFDLLDNFLKAGDKYKNIQPIPDSQLSLYLKSL